VRECLVLAHGGHESGYSCARSFKRGRALERRGSAAFSGAADPTSTQRLSGVTDASLADYDKGATNLVKQRVLAFLADVELRSVSRSRRAA